MIIRHIKKRDNVTAASTFVWINIHIHQNANVKENLFRTVMLIFKYYTRGPIILTNITTIFFFGITGI